MGKLIVIIALILMSLNADAQVFLGASEAEIRKSVEPTEKVTIASDGDYKILTVTESVAEPFFIKRYMLDAQSDVCLSYTVQPANAEAKKEFVVQCNKNFKAVNPTTWTTVVGGLKVKIRQDTYQGQTLFIFSPP